MIPVTKTYLPPLQDYMSLLEKIWESGWITNNGPLQGELEDRLTEYLGLEHLELVGNGTLALQLAIKALDLKGEIITTPYSYVATTTAILWEGCEPVFADIDENTFCIDPDEIEKCITGKTCAILATHVYGFPCDVDRISRIAERHNLKVIYDAAHCFGVTLKGNSLFRYGDISTMSFHATKTFHTAEGGALVTGDGALAKKIWLLKKFGHLGEDDYIEAGINAKMSELHAAMGLCVLPKVEEIIANRRNLFAMYDEAFSGRAVRVPAFSWEGKKNYAYYPVVFNTHEEMMSVRAALLKYEITPRRYFFPSLNTLPYLRPDLRRSCPVSESITSRVLCLPMYYGMGTEELQLVTRIILETLG